MPYDKATLQRIIDYCQEQWVEARDAQSAAPDQATELLTGKKMAYNAVYQFAQTLMSELPCGRHD